MTTEVSSSIRDEELIARIRAGEAHLYELIMRRYNQRIYRAARAIVKNEQEAEDVMQDAYVRAYEHLDEFEGRARFSTWLTRIAVHEALARVRRGRRFEPLDSNHEEPTMFTPHTPNAEQQASDGEMRLVLERAIDQLPDDFREVFILRAVEELSGTETAECLDIPEETVKTRLHRARTRLQHSILAAIEPRSRGCSSFRPRCDRVVAKVSEESRRYERCPPACGPVRLRSLRVRLGRDYLATKRRRMPILPWASPPHEECHRARSVVDVLALSFVACGGETPPASTPAGSNAAASTATFAEQVAEGQKLYGAHCASCHGAGGEGKDGPRVVGVAQGALPPDPPASSKFRKNKFHTAADIASFVVANMPSDVPGSLHEDQYWDILAFDLKANGVDLGTKHLDATTAAAVVIHP